MAKADTNPIARAVSDERDHLVSADDVIANLQIACGGTIPGLIAVPELLALTQKCRKFGFALARSVRAQTDSEDINAWVEIAPDTGNNGCKIAIVSWTVSERNQEFSDDDHKRERLATRSVAEVSARLDPQQRILTAVVRAPDLKEFGEKLRADHRALWTDLVELSDTHHKQPMHWRLLDGTTCRIDGSTRIWDVAISPIDSEAGGFDLILSAQTALGSGPESASPEPEPQRRPLLGRDLSPVLRQPIARIIANAETIRTRLAGPLAEEYSNYAADISSAGQHLLSLVEDLTDLEVVESDNFSAAPDEIDLADCARRTVGILGVKAQDKSITLIAPTEDEVLPAIGEFRRVLQVLLNLVGNAINYSPEGSTVQLSLSNNEAVAAVTVADEGPGLSPDQINSAFEKFERLGRSGDGGSGLGLYISRKLARAMGGDLTVSSAPGKGARFVLTLPTDTIVS